MTTLAMHRSIIREATASLPAILRFDIVLFDSSKIVAATGGNGTEIPEILTESGIRWGLEEAKKTGLKIDRVGGNGAIPRVVEAMGLRFE